MTTSRPHLSLGSSEPSSVIFLAERRKSNLLGTGPVTKLRVNREAPGDLNQARRRAAGQTIKLAGCMTGLPGVRLAAETRYLAALLLLKVLGNKLGRLVGSPQAALINAGSPSIAGLKETDMNTRKALAMTCVAVNIAWPGGQVFAQAIDILQDGNLIIPRTVGTVLGPQETPLVLTDPNTVLQRLAIERQLNSGELARRVLGGETTLNEQQLTDRLREFLQPAFAPVSGGEVLVLTSPPQLSAPSNVLPGGGTPYRPTSVAPDSVALLNRTDGPFEFRLTIGGAGKNARLLPNEFRTFECSPDCAEGALVNFDSLNPAAPGHIRIQGGAVYSVSFSDASGWTVLEVETLSFAVQP